MGWKTVTTVGGLAIGVVWLGSKWMDVRAQNQSLSKENNNLKQENQTTSQENNNLRTQNGSLNQENKNLKEQISKLKPQADSV